MNRVEVIGAVLYWPKSKQTTHNLHGHGGWGYVIAHLKNRSMLGNGLTKWVQNLRTAQKHYNLSANKGICVILETISTQSQSVVW